MAKNNNLAWAAAGFTAAIATNYLYNKLSPKKSAESHEITGDASTATPTAPSKVVNTGLKEYSVIYTDRAINLLSAPFKKIMRDISAAMKEVYNAHSVALIPGSGTYGMEAVARQFGTGKSVLIIRNGYSAPDNLSRSILNAVSQHYSLHVCKCGLCYFLFSIFYFLLFVVVLLLTMIMLAFNVVDIASQSEVFCFFLLCHHLYILAIVVVFVDANGGVQHTLLCMWQWRN